MHKLRCTKKQKGSQKAIFICMNKNCRNRFRFYGMYSTKETEDYVNKYYPENTI